MFYVLLAGTHMLRFDQSYSRMWDYKGILIPLKTNKIEIDVFQIRKTACKNLYTAHSRKRILFACFVVKCC